jgi:UDPglucose 6-dehydrogenase
MVGCLASKGYEVFGFDLDPNQSRRLVEGSSSIVEPGLETLLAENRQRIHLSKSIEDLVCATDVTFLVVPTPSDPSGEFSNRYVTQAAAAFGEAIAKKSDWHLFVLTSTVSPGSTQGSFIATIEQISGRRLGRDFGVCYNPLFIALGSVVKNLFYPDFVLVGESDERSGQTLGDIYRNVIPERASVARMSIPNAELTKIAVNAYVTMKISFANTLAEVCERLPGGDVDSVTKAVGLDTRVGGKYLTGGMAFGGPCFPRDNVAFAKAAKRLGVEAPLAIATDAVNLRQSDRTTKLALDCLKDRNRVGILGVSYKAGTNVIDESPAISIIENLLSHGKDVQVFDFLGYDLVEREYGSSVTYAASIDDCLAACDAIIIALPDERFSLEHVDFAELGNIAIIDCWRMIEPARCKAPAVLYQLGKPMAHTTAVAEPNSVMV